MNLCVVLLLACRIKILLTVFTDELSTSSKTLYRKKLVSFHRGFVSGLVVALRTIVVTVFLSFSAHNLLRIALFCHTLKIIDLCDPSIPNKQCLEINTLFQEDFGLFLENHSTSFVFNKF